MARRRRSSTGTNKRSNSQAGVLADEPGGGAAVNAALHTLRRTMRGFLQGDNDREKKSGTRQLPPFFS
jgi:hypothetical protein